MDEGPAPVRLSIVILTYRRVYELTALLPVVGRLALDAVGTSYEILVIDNDPDASAQETVRALEGYRARYVHEPIPGIAAARKRGLAESCSGEVIVYLDDDLVPESGWLPPLLRLWEQTRASAILGHVEYRLVGQIDPLIASGDFYRRRTYATGTRLATAASGNLLLDIEQVRSLGVDFTTELGLSGGEDTLFCSQLVAAGGRIVYCAESVVVGELGPDRANRVDTVTRLRAHAGILVRNRLIMAPSRSARGVIRTRAVSGGAIRVMIGMFYLLKGSAANSNAATARGIRLTSRGRGMARAGLFGHLVEEYTRQA